MNIATFLGHYQITENPFQAEEARHDSVFSRVETACFHPDFAKICGDFIHPSSSIVFGERGAGKTAIRLQIEQRLGEHNRTFSTQRCLPLIYDELNPVLDRFSRQVGGHSKRSGGGGPLETLKEFKLVDHIDAMMSAVAPKIIDQVLGENHGAKGILELDGPAARRFRQLDAQAKHDLLTLQLHYDRPESAPARTRRLKHAIRYRSRNSTSIYRWLSIIAAALSLGVVGYFLFKKPAEHTWLWYTVIILSLLFTAVMAGRFAWTWWRTHRLAAELARKLRVLDRPTPSFRASLLAVDIDDVFGAGLPRTNDDDMRYAMFGRLLNVIRPLGYQSILVLVDRMDEPTLINGEPERMRALVWPMLNNKFLQQDRIGMKLLLPLDLRYLLDRESPEFYREARLDKQNLVERLTWSGAILYDLCSARLNACRSSAVPGKDGSQISLRDLFDDSVTAQELADALDQMQQPRDAFKFVYQVIQEHCSNVPEESPQFKIPRPVLDGIRKRQVERMSGMLRGVRAG